MTLLLEYWKPIVGYEDAYQISNTGRVYSIRSKKELGYHVGSGYLRVCLYKNNKQKHHTIHDLVCQAFVGPRPDRLIINHIDGWKRSNKPSNLEYVTYKENAAHASRLGINNRGSRHGKAKLSELAVQEIRTLANTESHQAIAVKFGVHHSTISKALSGVQWRHVK